MYKVLHGLLAGSIVLLLAASIVLPVVAAQQETGDLETTIMLEKSRPAVVLIVSIASALAFWDVPVPQFEQVGFAPPVPVESVSFGSGFLVSSDGYIITNGHVVNDFESDLQEHLPLIQQIVFVYADYYTRVTGTQPTIDDLQQAFMYLMNAYVNNRLKLQDYNVLAFACLGKTVTGVGMIDKCKPARVVESRPFEREDLALLKIEIKHAPSLIVTAEEPRVGDRVWVLGYPGVVTFHDLLSETTTMIPTITSGVISGYREKVTGVTVLQSDVSVTHGNSGGPMLNSKGEVVAVTSFGSVDPTGSGREVPGFNFFIPSKYVLEMMQRNGVDNTPDPVMAIYEEGLRYYYEGDYEKAIESFKTVQDISPGFPYVDDMIADAQSRLLAGEGRHTILGLDQWQITGIGVALLAIVAALAYKRGMIPHRQPQPHDVVGPASPYTPISTEASTGQASTQHARPVEPGGTAQAGPGEGEARPVASGIAYCWNCGRPIPADALICPYCGVKQEEG